METCGVYSFKIDHSGSCGDCQIIEIEELSAQNHWKASEFAPAASVTSQSAIAAIPLWNKYDLFFYLVFVFS
jgi:hypothetical protein